METKYYPLDKSRFILIIAIFIVLAIGSLLGLFYIYKNAKNGDYAFISNILVTLHILGILGTIITMLDLALDKKGLTVNSNGITFNTGLVKFGPIEWADVVSAHKKRYMMNNYVIIHLKNPAVFISARKGLNKRIYSENHTTHGSPVVINASQLLGDIDAILAELNGRVLADA